MFNWNRINKKLTLTLLTALSLIATGLGIWLAAGSHSVLANISLVCPPGSSLSGSNCIAANKFAICPVGGQVQGGQCVATPGTPVSLTNQTCASLYPPKTASVLRNGRMVTVTVLNVGDFTPLAGVPTCHVSGTVAVEVEMLGSWNNFCIPQQGAAYRLKPTGIIVCGVDYSIYSADETGSSVTGSFVFQKRAISNYSYAASFICPTGWSDAGGSNCYKPAISINTAAPNLPISQAGIDTGSCNGQTVQINNLFDCVFPLSGSSNGQYSSSSPIEAALPWGTISRSCAISGSSLICRNITANPNANNPDTQSPRLGRAIGVYLRLDPNSGNWIMKGAINVTDQPVPNGQQTVKGANITTVAQDSNQSNSQNSSSSDSSNSSSTTSSDQNQSSQSDSSDRSSDTQFLVAQDFRINRSSDGSNNSRGIDLTCNFGNPAMIASSVSCSFDLPQDRRLPDDLKIAIGERATPSGNCTALNSQSVLCTNVPTDSQIGQQSIFVQVGSGDKLDTGNRLELVENAIVGTTIRSGGFLALSLFLFLAGISAVVFFYIRKRSKGMLFS